MRDAGRRINAELANRLQVGRRQRRQADAGRHVAQAGRLPAVRQRALRRAFEAVLVDRIAIVVHQVDGAGNRQHVEHRRHGHHHGVGRLAGPEHERQAGRRAEALPQANTISVSRTLRSDHQARPSPKHAGQQWPAAPASGRLLRRWPRFRPADRPSGPFPDRCRTARSASISTPSLRCQGSGPSGTRRPTTDAEILDRLVRQHDDDARLLAVRADERALSVA